MTGRTGDAETRSYEERMLAEHSKRMARYERLARVYAEKSEIEKRYVFAYGMAVKQQKGAA